MPARESEAFILRTYPFGEADLIVSYFTRDLGKLRGIAKGVRRPKSRFGAGLERLSHVKVFYYQKHTVELARIDKAELLDPPLTMRADYPVSVALDYIAEVAEETLPEHEPDDPHYRLLALALEEISAGVTRSTANGGGVPGFVWRALTYFSLWTVRLGGWLPAPRLPGNRRCARARRDGLVRPRPRRAALGGSEVSVIVGALAGIASAGEGDVAHSIAQATRARMEPRDGPRPPPVLDQRLEAHIEKRLKTLRVLEHF
ncbi:MAG: DNA repair protein RecO [Bryobacterales bacterium]